MEAPDHPSEEPIAARNILLHVVSTDLPRLSFPNTPVTTNVGGVKFKILERLPALLGETLPASYVTRLRLIYQGRALLDLSAPLETVFGPEASKASDEFTLHLVLPPWKRDGTGRGGTGSTDQASGQNWYNRSPADTHRSDRVPPHPNASDAPSHQATGLPNPPSIPQPHHHPHGPQFPRMPVPGAGMPMPEQMRQAFAHHMQQHESMQRLFAQGQQAPHPSHPQETSADGNTATTTGYEPRPAEGNQPQRANGNTVVREGQGPMGQWRVVMNHTTVPMRPGAEHPQPTATSNTANPDPQAPRNPLQVPFTHSPPPFGNAGGMPFPFPLPSLPNMIRPAFPPQPSFPPVVYLLSSPAGYQAVLVPPHPGRQPNPFSPPTQDVNTVNGRHDQETQREHDHEGQPNGVEGEAQQQDEAVDILRIIFPLGGHLWLLIRLAGLVYLIAGGATWTRTILLSTAALFIFIGQAGWLAPVYRHVAEPLRRHLEGLIRVDQRAPAPPQPGQQAARQAAAGPEVQPAAAVVAPGPANGPGVTPEQLAARLLRQREEADQSLVRSAMRRVERSVALFIASLIPGVGEGHVAAQQEAEQARRRREQEQEVAQRRVIEAAATSAEAEPTASAGDITDTTEPAGGMMGSSSATAEVSNDGTEPRLRATPAASAVGAE